MWFVSYGQWMGKYLQEKEGIQIAGAICSIKRKNGMNLGVLLVIKNGIICRNNANTVARH